jgi:transcription antitermination factor NusG
MQGSIGETGGPEKEKRQSDEVAECRQSGVRIFPIVPIVGGGQEAEEVRMIVSRATSDKNASLEGTSGHTAGCLEVACAKRSEVARWFALKTRSRQEKALARALAAAGVDHYLPLVERVRYHGHRKRTVTEPLFATYLFLHGTIETTYFALATRRVASVIPVSDQDRLVHEIEQIREALARRGALVPERYLKRGRRVRVTSGPFKGIEGLIEEVPKTDRLVLQVEALGRATSLEIDSGLLEPVG